MYQSHVTTSSQHKSTAQKPELTEKIKRPVSSELKNILLFDWLIQKCTNCVVRSKSVLWINSDINRTQNLFTFNLTCLLTSESKMLQNRSRLQLFYCRTEMHFTIELDIKVIKLFYWSAGCDATKLVRKQSRYLHIYHHACLSCKLKTLCIKDEKRRSVPPPPSPEIKCFRNLWWLHPDR